jgi:hypothetical protein
MCKITIAVITAVLSNSGFTFHAPESAHTRLLNAGNMCMSASRVNSRSDLPECTLQQLTASQKDCVNKVYEDFKLSENPVTEENPAKSAAE